MGRPRKNRPPKSPGLRRTPLFANDSGEIIPVEHFYVVLVCDAQDKPWSFFERPRKGWSMERHTCALPGSGLYHKAGNAMRRAAQLNARYQTDRFAAYRVTAVARANLHRGQASNIDRQRRWLERQRERQALECLPKQGGPQFIPLTLGSADAPGIALARREPLTTAPYCQNCGRWLNNTLDPYYSEAYGDLCAKCAGKAVAPVHKISGRLDPEGE